MEWIYLVLILAFVSWAVQIVMVYKRQADRMDQQVQAARINQEELTQQAEKYEARVEELTAELDELKGKAGEWESKEKAIEHQLKEH